MKLSNLENIKELLDFSNDGIYTMILIARKKNNSGITNSQELVFREIVRSSDSFDKKLSTLLDIAKLRDEEFKLYINFNPRDIKKAYKLLKSEFVNWDDDLTKSGEIVSQTIEKLKRIDLRFISSLQKSALKKSFYMIDLDDKTKLNKILDIFEKTTSSKILFNFETKNGFHLLFKPCDTRNFLEEINNLKIDCEIKKDDLLCLGYEDKN